MSEEAAARAVALVEQLFALLHDGRALVPQLEATRTDPEPVSAQAERLLYYALVGALEAGLVRTAEDALTVLRQASQPLAPVLALLLATRGQVMAPMVRMPGASGKCALSDTPRP